MILPKDNQKDLTEIPANIKDDFTVHFVESMDEVLKLALTHAPTPLLEETPPEAIPFQSGPGAEGDLQQESIMH